MSREYVEIGSCEGQIIKGRDGKTHGAVVILSGNENHLTERQ